MVTQEKELRSASQGQLRVFLRKETNNSFRVQSKRIWNSLDDKEIAIFVHIGIGKVGKLFSNQGKPLL
jgi:hypothetical protein